MHLLCNVQRKSRRNQIGILVAKLKRLFDKRNPAVAFDHEMHEHLRLLTERYIRTEWTPSDADSAERRLLVLTYRHWIRAFHLRSESCGQKDPG